MPEPSIESVWLWAFCYLDGLKHIPVCRLLPILSTGKCYRKSTAPPTGNVNRQSCQRNAIPSTSLLVLESGACQTKSGCNLGRTGSLICNALAVLTSYLIWKLPQTSCGRSLTADASQATRTPPDHWWMSSCGWEWMRDILLFSVILKSHYLLKKIKSYSRKTKITH